MCQNKTKEQMRDHAIGMLEEARDGLDAVLSELKYGGALAQSDTRIGNSMDLIHQAEQIVRWLYEDSGNWTDRVPKRFVENAHERLNAIFEPGRIDEITRAIGDLDQVILYLRACNLPVKV